MNDQPLVSILVVTFNQLQFIPKCLDSCLSQSYSNIEVIVSDDCSEDNTQSILIDYATKHPKTIKPIFSDKNTGITLNFQRALKKCQGSFIALLGGDDYLHPDKVYTQVKFMQERPECIISFHNMDVFNSSNGVHIKFFNDFDFFVGNQSSLIKSGVINCGSSTMFVSSAVPSFGFRSSLPVASDWMFYIDLLAQGGTINYIPLVLGYYRRHERNVTNPSNQLTQNKIDIIVSGLLVISDYPHQTLSSLDSLSRNILELRWKVPYFIVLFTSFMLRPNLYPLKILIYDLIALLKRLVYSR